ncbi:serine/threonine-protein kinase [Brachybacterium sp. Marseille-Q7125]|uniref:serine/threonine-protein kinase n=1 Tax=Brachybacterium sp. Marseille-Q7125 TaxID=2932815 RepID=UPI001FF69EBC|nr:serine/threonine-protein kinase [Brachybacterium sp. Marseille-Q7125]
MADVIAGRIALIDPLARGASGSLWRAVDRRYEAVCAAKVMLQRDGAEVLRFVREQTVGGAQDLGSHPHLLPPYTWVAEDDTIVLVMPLIHGGTVADALREQGALSPGLVAHLLRQLLDGLAALHAAGWVHRDVKPANLLLQLSGETAPHLLLADFGIALHEQDIRLTDTGMVAGTPGFIAPEVRIGEGSGGSQDVWAAAACALEALEPVRLADLPEAEQQDPALRVRRVLAASSDPAARSLMWVLLRMLDPDPLMRPSAAEARDLLPVADPSASESWSLRADGEPFVVRDRIPAPPPGSVPAAEVGADGPGSIAPAAPGLHERITAQSHPTRVSTSAPGQSPSGAARSASAPSPVATTPLTPQSAAPASEQTPARGASPAGGAAPVGAAGSVAYSPTPVSPFLPLEPGSLGPATDPTVPREVARRRAVRTVLGSVMLVGSAVCLVGAGTLAVLALG